MAPDLPNKLRGRPNEALDVRVSKTLSYILRHGAAKESLVMRADGYVKVTELLARPMMKSVDFTMIQKIVADNAKQRFSLKFEPANGVEKEDGIWWIRANQGHSIKVDSLELEEIKSAEEIPVAIHGTSNKAWESVAKEGLSRMYRNHIHLASGLPSDEGVISGMRSGAEVLIYIDTTKAMAAGYRFFRSANGVILSDGDERGFIPPEYFAHIEFKARRERKCGVSVPNQE
ncbi:hypothetical protein BS47DRAFT_1346888 [Hydnum rufescens UP504]|uniref:2'-phosphotransferase n=1 Tax=Hydnum rufescens UP504 TaxID=1448309 RepID=A0A9P6DU78_9AGAM|nr:hypothetical protein BS47DRAFT_1346888 [Hydnum rufescens UP504]